MKKLVLLCFFSISIHSQDVTSILNDLKTTQLQDNLEQPNQIDQTIAKEQLMQQSTQDDDENHEKSKYFGFDYIKSLSTDIPSYNSLPVPNDYSVTFNDRLRVMLSGSKNEIYNLNIGLDGAILIPELGIVQAVGKSFSELKKNIENLVKVSYVGVNVDISITNLSAKKISVIGAVKSPGVYIVNPFTTISNSLAYIDDLEDYASLRNIKLIKGTGEEYNFDLYELIVKGDRTNDLVLSAGDTVLIGSTDNHVLVEGEVYREFIYEYKENDTYRDLIDFAMGKRLGSVEDNIYVDFRQGNVFVTSNVNLDEKIGNRNIDRLFIPHKTSYNLRDIKVSGKSIQDGYFSPEKFSNLRSLFESLEMSDDFYPFFGFLKKSNPYTFESNLIIFNPTDLLSLEDIELTHNDELFFFGSDEIVQFNLFKAYLDEEEKKLKEEKEANSLLNKLSINEDSLTKQSGAQQKTAKEKFDESYFNQDEFEDEKLEKFGPFYEDKYLFDILNRNLIAINYGKNDINYLPVGPNIIPELILSYLPDEISEEMLKNIRISTNQEDLGEGLLRKPILNAAGSSITIPTNDPEFLIIEVRGHIKSPGSYIVSRDTTLQEVYDIAGGFLETADQESIILQREKLKEQERTSAKKARQDILDTLISSLSNISSTTPPQIDSSLLAFYQETENLDFYGRYSGDISNGSAVALNLAVEDGDYIYVPPLRDSVSVIGQVQNQITVSYNEKLDINDYIKMTGGFSEYADKNGIYIIASNGVSRFASRRFFAKDEFFISPGDTIVVPREFGTVRGVALASIAVSTLSNLAIAAASLNSISR